MAGASAVTVNNKDMEPAVMDLTIERICNKCYSGGIRGC